MGVRSSTARTPSDIAAFEEWVRLAGPRLRRALICHYGTEVGPDVHAEAIAYAWEHWVRLQAMANPLGYLYRVGQSAARRHPAIRSAPVLPAEPRPERYGPEPGLDQALRSLTEDQRVAVVLVHGYGYSYGEAADIVDLPVTTLRNHVHRGMTRLRGLIGETQ